MSQAICKCQQHSVTVGNDREYCREPDHYWQMFIWSLKPACEKRLFLMHSEEREDRNSLQLFKELIRPELFKGKMKAPNQVFLTWLG